MIRYSRCGLDYKGVKVEKREEIESSSFDMTNILLLVLLLVVVIIFIFK